MVFCYETDKEENITKFKARLVARGFTQICDVDYTHSSSLRPLSASIKLVLAVVNERGLPLHYFNVAQVYFWASRDEEVYMKLPGGCGEKSKTTRQVGGGDLRPEAEYAQVGSFVCGYSDSGWFEQCKADQGIFRKIIDQVVVMTIGVYEDGLLVGGSQE